MRTAALLIAVTALAGGTAAPAQPPADTAAVAEAFASHLAGKGAWMLGKEPVLLSPPEARFDSAVARLLHPEPLLRRPVRDSAHALRLRTRGVTLSGDSAAVVFEIGRCEPKNESLNWWVERLRVWFVRDGAAWRFARHESIASIDGHCGPDVEGAGDEPA